MKISLIPVSVLTPTVSSVYFVPYSWWRDAQDSVMGDSNGNKGVLCVASPTALSLDLIGRLM
ncbi:hypothetical protein RchiOBHm_Chr3g0455291 [Rosa chinensis]|uniref:Uncharacterized protein n=1 Tax=Rosa chinensis TaxID=74649 RepID=A0A2P6R710_ROSCH|nr:hypothetical protein RchiOBHm_Chr3g0455291 [Rosa chinensis]